jgi:hypothetical protein
MEAPPNSLQLVKIEPFVAGGLSFTFQNVSKKTILEFRIAAPNGHSTGVDGFTLGVGTVASGATMSAIFSEGDFSSGNLVDQNLRVEAIIYTDGSCAGSEKTLDFIEDEMLGAALETRRDSQILAASPDASVAGFDAVVADIDKALPSTNAEIAEAMRGIALTGVPQSYIDKRMRLQPGILGSGISTARQMLLIEIKNKKEFASKPLTRSHVQQDRVKRAQSQGLSDLAQKYKTLSDAQAQYIRDFRGTTYAN